MKFKLFAILSSFGLLFVTEAVADTVLLNNGEKHEGKVVYEDNTFCLLEIEVSKGIKDEKKFLKSDIKSITKSTPDIEEFKKLQTFTPTPDLLGLAEYEQRVKLVDTFIKTYGRSQKLTDAKKMLAILEEELKVVRAGGMKFQGKMVTAEEYKASAYAYDELMAVQKINKDIANRNLLGALRSYTELEADFPEGSGREELVPKIKMVLNAYQENLRESLDTFDIRMKQRETGLATMSLEDREKTERAIEDQALALKKRFEAEKLMKNGWVTPDANYKESLVEALRQADTLSKRLSSPPKKPSLTKPLDEVYRESWEKIASANAEQKKAIFDQLKKDRMPEKYVNLIKERAPSE